MIEFFEILIQNYIPKNIQKYIQRQVKLSEAKQRQKAKRDRVSRLGFGRSGNGLKIFTEK